MEGLTVLSSFTGLGGLDLGLKKAGFDTIACIERNEHARQSILDNSPSWNLLETADIVDVARTLTTESLGLKPRQLSILAGAPPCQPFSKAAQWRDNAMNGLCDARSKSIDSFLDIAECFLPQVIMIENVAGFVRGRTSAVTAISQRLERLNRKCKTRYRLQHRTLNAMNFGVPQRRFRAILIADRDGREFEWPTPTHAERPTRAWDAIHDSHSSAPLPAPRGYWSDLLPSIPEGRNYLFHTSQGGGEQLFGVRTRFWSFLLKLAKNEPSWTLPANPGPSTGPFHWDNRPLTTAERLRLQSFPKAWKVSGSEYQKNLQVGNATPPLLAEVIGRELMVQYWGGKYERRPFLTIARKRVVPAARPTTAIPEKFRKHIGTHAPHPGQGKGPGAQTR